MVTIDHKGDRIDVGAQFFHSDYRNVLNLMKAVNIGGDRRTIHGRIQFMLEDGTPYLYDHRIPYMKPLGLRGNLKLYWFFLRYILLGPRFPMYQIVKDIPAYDDVETLELFNEPSDQALRDYFVTPVCMEPPERLSLYHFIHTFRLSAFTSFFTLCRGSASLPEAMAKSLPVKYGSPVKRLVTEKNQVVGVEMESDGSINKADHIIVAVAPPSVARLLPEELEDQRRFFESITHVPFPMPVLFLDRPLRKDVWSYFNYPGDKRTYLFAVDQSAKMPEMIPSGKAVLNAWLGYPENPEFVDRPDEEILKIARDDLELMIPGVSKWIDDAMVFRHPYHVAEYPIGTYRRIIEFLRQSERLNGVSFVSDLFGGSYIEGALLSAAKAVNRVCGL